MAIAPLPPVVGEIQQYTGQPGRTAARFVPVTGLLDLQIEQPQQAAVAIVPQTSVLELAISEALGRQGSMAPLFAALAGVSAASGVTEVLADAVQGLLGFRLGEEQTVSAAALRRAVASSGLFHEAAAGSSNDLKAALLALRDAAAAVMQQTNPPATGMERLRAELDQAIADPSLLTRTDAASLTTLRTFLKNIRTAADAPRSLKAMALEIADLEERPATGGALPLTELTEQLMALRRAIAATFDAPAPAAADAKGATRPLGQRVIDELDHLLARPTALAALAAGQGDPQILSLMDKLASVAGLPPALKAALLQVLSAGSQPMTSQEMSEVLVALRQQVVAWSGASADRPARPRHDGARPAPPRKGGPLVAQKAEPSELIESEDLAIRLHEDSGRALSRLFLHQAVLADSLNDRDAAAEPPSLVFELPIAGPTGTSIAQFRIGRDEGRGRDANEPRRGPSYRAEIAFDIAPLGPVNVRVGLLPGQRVAVGIWCEEATGFDRLQGERQWLITTLEAAGFTVSGIDLHRGRPSEPNDAAVKPPHRLDLQL